MGVALMCASIIAYSFIRSYSNLNSFVQSGYIHTDPSISENKKLLFTEGEKYHLSLNNTISFNDINQTERTVVAETFIHYDDDSIAAFCDGVIVDLEELNSDSTMSHYHMSANVSIEKQGSSYVAIANGQEISFTDFIWKLSENKYLVISPSIMATLSGEDIREVGSYAEITYLDDRVIQIQTEDNIWQTISKDCKLQTANGATIDLPMRSINDENDDVLLDFNRMVIDSNDNVEVAPLSDEEKVLTNNKIPHFTVESKEGDPGLSGTTGTPGLIGSDGNYGVAGLQGSEGESESEDETILKFPIFSIKDWNVTSSSCTGKVAVVDEEGMIQADSTDVSSGLFGQLYLVDLSAGSKIYLSPYTSAGPSQFNFKEAADNESAIEFTFTGLQTDHSYMLCVSAPLKPDDETETYLRTFITKTFWTDSLGVYMEPGESTIDSVSLVINKEAGSSTTVYCLDTLFNNYENAAQITLSSLQSMSSSMTRVEDFNSSNQKTIEYHNNPGDDYYQSNSSYYALLAYDLNNDNIFDDYSTQVLELKTLKQPASIGSPIFKANRNNWGFDVTPGSIYDPDGGITKYVYEFYDADQFDTTGNLISNPTISKTITTSSSSPFAISLDGVSLKGNMSYRVRATAYFSDNAKSYTLVSGFSNEARLDGATKPKVYFETQISSGTSTLSPYYDTISGVLHINPGNDGSKLIIDSGRRINPARVTVSDSSSYSMTYDILPIEETVGKIKGTYFVGVVNEDGDVSVSFNDYENDRYSWVSGLKPNRDYEISVTGDLSEDGVNLIELNTSVGKCNVKTAELEDFTIYSSYVPNDNSEILKGFRFAIKSDTSSEANIRQRYALYGVEVNVYPGDKTTATTLPSPIASKVFTVNDKWVNSDGQKVLTYYDSNNASYQNGIDVVEVNNAGTIYYYRANEYGEKTATEPIKDGSTIITPTEIQNSAGTKIIVEKTVIDEMFSAHYVATPLIDGTTDYVIDKGGLLITADDFGETQKNAISNVPDSGVTIIINKLYDYTYNTNDSCKINQKPSTYVNEFNITGETKTFVQFSQDITDIILSYPFAKLIRETNSYTNYYYLMQAQFNNKGFLAESITYYVYDAVDFYKGSYTRTSNSELLNYANSTTATSADEISYILQDSTFTSPVLEEGLELAKITVNMGASATVPTVLFYPYTKQSYAQRNNISISNVPNEFGGNKIMYLHDGSTEGVYGHQYVFCWTVNYHAFEVSGQTGKKLVYPFDASVKCKVGSTIGSHPAGILDTYKFSEFAEVPKDNSIFDIDGAYWKDGQRKYGKDCYILLPHAEKTSDTSSVCDEPIPLPKSYAIQYASDDTSVTMKTFIIDDYGAVYQSDLNACTPYRLLSTSGGISADALIGNTVKINKSSSTDSSVTTASLVGNNTTYGVSTITLNKTQVSNAINSNFIVLLMPIQLYSNKYTNSHSSLHAGASYITASDDNNWKFTPSNEYKSKYCELLTAKFNNAENYSSFYNGDYSKYDATTPSTTNPHTENLYELDILSEYVETQDTQVVQGKMYYSDASGTPATIPSNGNPKQENCFEKHFVQTSDTNVISGKTYYKKTISVNLQSSIIMDVRGELTDSGSASSYYVHLYGPESQIKNAIGVRLLVGNKLKIDKYLLSSISHSDYTNEHKDFPGTNVKLNRDSFGNIHMYFMIDVDKDLSTRVTEFGNDSFDGTNDVTLSASLLYETNSTGLGLLDPFRTTSNTNYFSKTNDITLALKSINAANVSSSGLNYLNAMDSNYLAYTTSNNSLSNPNSSYVVANASGGTAYGLSKFGSFLQMYGRISNSEKKAYIQVRSTRYWNTSTLAQAYTINPLVQEGSYLLPVKVNEGGNIMLRQYDSSTNSYGDEATQILLDIAGANKSISDYHHTVVRQKGEVEFSLHGVPETENVYFTITKENSTQDIVTSIEHTGFRFNEDTSDGSSIYNLIGETTIPANFFDVSSSESDADAYLATLDDGLKDIFIKVPGDATKIDLGYLKYSTNYTVTCWSWNMVDTEYKFVKLKMIVDSSSTINNYYSFATGPLEVPSEITANWYANDYDNKLIEYGVTDIDYDSLYYVVDLLNSSDDLLTHLYATDADAINYFDADSLNVTTGYNIIYPLDNISISHDGDNHITFTSSDPNEYFQGLEYGETYKIKLRVYEKGYGPAWADSSPYDYVSDFNNVLNVFVFSTDPISGLPILTKDTLQSQDVFSEFSIDDETDACTGRISSTIEVKGGSDVSYITYIIPNVSNASHSIRYSRFTPVVIREHVEGSTTQYSDVTKDILSIDNKTYAETNGIYSFGQSLHINITKLNGSIYEDKYSIGDVIHIFIYSYQDDRTGTVALDSTNTLSNLTSSKILEGRYTVKNVDSLITADEYAKLSDEYINTSNTGSRLMDQWSRAVTSAEINAGKISASILPPIAGNEYITVLFKEASGVTSFTKIQYQITVFSNKNTQFGGVQPNDPIVGDLKEENLSLAQTQSPSCIIDITNFMNTVRNNIGENSNITKIEITMKFLDNKVPAEYIDITPDPDDSAATVSADKKTITYSITYH